MKQEKNICDSEEEMKGEETLCDSEDEMEEKENLCVSEDEMEEKENLCVSEDEVEELEGESSTNVICEREDLFYWSQVQWEQVENPNFTEESLAIGKVCEVQEEDEAAEMIRTRELVEKKIMLEEAFESMEVVKEIVEADEDLGMTFVPRDSSEDLLTTVEEESETREPETEAVDGEIFCDGFIMENETTEIMFWKKDEHFEEEKYMTAGLNNASDVEIEPPISSSKETAGGTADFFIFMDEKQSALEDSIDGGNSFKEVPCGAEKIVQKFPLVCEEELEKTLPQASDVQNVGLEEDSEQEEVEPWVGEPPLDWATEENISVMKKDHQAEKIITEEAESFDKLFTREEVIKAMVKSNERGQEEESSLKTMEEDIGDTEDMSIFEETVPEWKQKLFSEEPFKTIPEAFALVAGREETEDNLDVEVAEREVKGELEDEEIEREGSVNDGICAIEATGYMTLQWGIDEEAEGQMADEDEVEAAESESEEAVNEEVDFGVVLSKMTVKREIDIEYPEGDMAVVRGLEDEETECEVAVKGKVSDEEEEKGEVDKWQLDADESEGLATVEEEVEAVDYEREVVFSEELDAKVIGNVLDIEKTERDMAVEGEVEDEDLSTEEDVTCMNIGSEGEIVSEVKCRENVVDTLRARLEEAKVIPELSAQELSLEGGGLTQLMGMMNEQTIQDKIGKSSEALVVEKTSTDSDFDLVIKKSSATDYSIDNEESINILMKKENVPVEEEKENETSTEELTLDGVVSLQVMEEALLIGIQQLITDVSQLSVGVDNEEEEELESLVEESSHENPMKNEPLANVIAEERTTAQGDEADVKGTELGKEIYFEEKYERGNEETETGDNSVESLLETETIPWNTQQSRTEQQQDSSAQISNQESSEMSDLQDEH